MLERALKSLQLMVHRSGSVDGEGDGSGLMVDLPRPTWRRRLEAEGLDPAAADEARFTVAHIFFDSPAEAERGVPLILTLLGEHGFEVVWSGEGTVDRGALGPRAAETPPIFWQIACLAGEPGAPASRGCYRAMVAIEREVDCHVASFSANDAVYKVQGQPEVIPRFYPEMQEEDFALLADHRPQPLLDEHVPDLQPGAAVLDPRPQRRDQHDRPAPRAERAARPADHPRRLGQPGPQPPARGPDLREGPLAAGGGRVRPAADPRRGPPPAGEAPGPLRPLPRGAGPVRPGAGRAGLAEPPTRWSSRWTPWACARSGGSRPTSSTSSPPSRASSRSPSSRATPPRWRRARRSPS